METASREEMEIAGLARTEEKLFVQFFMESVEDPIATRGGLLPDPENPGEYIKVKPAGRPIFKMVPFIRIAIPGDKDHVVIREVWDEPNNKNSDTYRFHRAWERFKAGLMGEAQTVGTPLLKLTELKPPIITKAEVKELEFFNVKTAEQFAEMPAGVGQKFMGFAEKQRRVQAYIAAMSAAAPVTGLQDQIKEQQSTIDVLKAQIQKLMGGQIQVAQPEPGSITAETPAAAKPIRRKKGAEATAE